MRVVRRRVRDWRLQRRDRRDVLRVGLVLVPVSVKRTFAACTLVIWSAACRDVPRALPPPRTLLAVPIVRQANTYSCGAAALMSVLYYYQRYDGTEVGLYDRLGTTEHDGTHPARIVATAQSFGLRADLRQGVRVDEIRTALEHHEPVIVDLQAWSDDAPRLGWADVWEDGHYVVAVGIEGGRMYVMDPSTPGGYAYVDLAELPARWHDYEEVDGARVEYRRMAIFFGGRTPTPSYPRSPARME
jgi:predicted double-glycine peptidase